MHRYISIVVFAALLAQVGYVSDLRSAAQRMSWFGPLQASIGLELAAGAAQADQWAADNTIGKGVLERRFRLRSRLNTHLLMKKFQQ